MAFTAMNTQETSRLDQYMEAVKKIYAGSLKDVLHLLIIDLISDNNLEIVKEDEAGRLCRNRYGRYIFIKKNGTFTTEHGYDGEDFDDLSKEERFHLKLLNAQSLTYVDTQKSFIVAEASYGEYGYWVTINVNGVSSMVHAENGLIAYDILDKYNIFDLEKAS